MNSKETEIPRINFHEMSMRHMLGANTKEWTQGDHCLAILYKGDTPGVNGKDLEAYYVVSLNVETEIQEPVHYMTLIRSQFKIGEGQAHGSKLSNKEFAKELKNSFEFHEYRFKVGEYFSQLTLTKTDLIKRIQKYWHLREEGNNIGSFTVRFPLNPEEGFTPFRNITVNDTLKGNCKPRRGETRIQPNFWIEEN